MELVYKAESEQLLPPLHLKDNKDAYPLTSGSNPWWTLWARPLYSLWWCFMSPAIVQLLLHSDAGNQGEGIWAKKKVVIILDLPSMHFGKNYDL